MSNEPDKDKAPEPEGPTAAQLKEQIEEKKRERKAAQKASAPEPEPQPAAPAPSPEPPALDKPSEPAPASDAGAVPAPAPKTAGKVDYQEWMKKKGFKTSEDMAHSLRELERELSRIKADKQPPAPTGQPSYPIPPYQPPMPPQPQIEELAKRYNLDPSDFERVAPLAADIAANQTARAVAPLMAQIEAMRKDSARERDLQGVKEDPSFKDPRVQYEMHQILEKNPTILEIEPAPWRYAFNEALRSIARRILEGSIEPGETPQANSGPAPYPTTPPVTARGGGNAPSGGPGIVSPSPVDPAKFAHLSSDEMRKVLGQVGAVRPG